MDEQRTKVIEGKASPVISDTMDDSAKPLD
jgi:hypothetical protein